jgi:DNA invertase Pin-like site-specific DNA recombinase
MAKIGYARVSTREQNTAHQEDALKAAGCEKIFIDKASGKLAKRPKLEELWSFIRAGDILVVTKLSRLGRSTRDLLAISDRLDAGGMHLSILDLGIDTSTPAGQLLFTIFGGFAQFERQLIVEGTMDGLEAARARGRVGGRRPKLNDRQISIAREMYDSVGEDGKRKYTVLEIAETFGVDRRTIYRHLDPEKAVSPSSS